MTNGFSKLITYSIESKPGSKLTKCLIESKSGRIHVPCQMISRSTHQVGQFRNNVINH